MRTRLTLLACLFVFVLIVLGCNNDSVPLRFTGATETWEAEYAVNKVSNQLHEEELVLRYKGKDELNSTVKFEFNTNGGGGSLVSEVTGNQKVFKIKGGGSGAVPTQEDIVTVRAQWNGKTEEFTLTHKLEAM